jgi:hypothetical protein
MFHTSQKSLVKFSLQSLALARAKSSNKKLNFEIYTYEWSVFLMVLL